MPGCAYIGSILIPPPNVVTVTGPGIPQVLVNGNVISVLQDDTSDGGKMVEGSADVFAGGKPVCRKGDKNSKHKTIILNVSTDVLIDGP